ALSWLTGSSVLNAFTIILAALTPLASLTVAEGLLRRHAPRSLKLAVSGGAILVAGLLPIAPDVVAVAALLAVVTGGFVAIAILLWTRDRGSLTVAENQAVQRLVLVMILLSPLLITDFRAIWPDVPVRLGAVGALIVLFAGFGPGGAHLRGRDRALNL